MAPRNLFIMIIYMILVYTTVHAFTFGASGLFEVGGDRTDLMVAGDDTSAFDSMVGIVASGNLTVAQKWSYMNESYGEYQGLLLTGNWLDTGYYHVWRDSSGYETKIIDWKFAKYLVGSLDWDDISFQESAGNVLGSIWKGLGYISGLFTFNIAGDTYLSDGSQIPVMLSWIPLIMVLPCWIAITYWILPYAIEVLKAIGGLIPFT